MQTNEKVTLYIENPETPSGKQNITPLLRGMNVLTGEAIDYTMKLTGNKLDETRFIETGSMFNDHFLLLVGSVPVVGEAGQRTTAPVIHTKEGLKEKFPFLTPAKWEKVFDAIEAAGGKIKNEHNEEVDLKSTSTRAYLAGALGAKANKPKRIPGTKLYL